MALSYTEYVGTGGGTAGPFSYGGPVDFLPVDSESISTQLKVYINGVLRTYTTDYTIDIPNEDITLVGLLLYSNDILRLARETKKDVRYVDFVDGTNITSEILDLDSNQLFFIVQEAFDLQTDAMTLGTDGQWNGRGRRVGTIASGVNGTDAVTVNQLNAAVSGALPASLSGYNTVVYSGDNSTTAFALPDAISGITDPSDVEVYINGLRQRPATHYSISAGFVNISPPPVIADRIMLAHAEGAVSAVLTANSVTTNSIQNDAVTVAKIAQGTNGQLLATVAGETAWATATASYISDFDTAVRLSKLNQMATATGNYSMGSNKITNLAAAVADSDAINFGDVKTLRINTATSATAALTGTVSAVSGNVAFGSTLGGVIITFPVTTSTYGISWESVAIAMANSSTDPVLLTTHRKGDLTSMAQFSITWVRSGGGNGLLAFTITRSTTTGTSIDLINGSTAYVQMLRGAT